MEVSEKSNRSYLEFPIKMLTWLGLWSSEHTSLLDVIKKYSVLFLVISSIIFTLADVLALLREGEYDLLEVNDSFIPAVVLSGVIYILTCFKFKAKDVKLLIEDLKIFEEFSSEKVRDEADNYANFFTKFFMIYGFIGNICYCMVPLIVFKSCQERRTEHKIKYGIACGMMGNYFLPFKYDYTPVIQIMVVEQFLATTASTFVIMAITMLLCSVLIHVTFHLKYLRIRVQETSSLFGKELESHVRYCVKYHITIIGYTDKINKCFGAMMLLHITLTAFIIGVLGFEIIALTNFVEAIRFVLHMGGWLMMLFILCYYGQLLLDDSFEISNAIYEAEWYNMPVPIQKTLCLMMFRAQIPLVLTAAGLKIMSFATFIGIMYSSYSYFTLLLKVKS